MSSSNTLLSCPYCNITIEVAEINCAIFRCGIYKNIIDANYGKQIDPHLSKNDCDALKKEDKIWGCGRPFKFINVNGLSQLIQCDYI
jgi:hypothetical protein